MLVKINFYNIQFLVANRVLTIILMSLVLSCNQVKSSSARTDSNKVNPNQKLVKADLIIPAIGDWELRGISAKIVRPFRDPQWTFQGATRPFRGPKRLLRVAKRPFWIPKRPYYHC